MTGARESKKAQTRARIADAGLALFKTRGYEATTIDDIAEAAGISRRSFFSYFKSKDDVLLAWLGAGAISSALGQAMLAQSPDQDPLEAAVTCISELTSRYETPESKATDTLMQTSDTLRAQKDAAEIRMERDLLTAMAVLWPEAERRIELRIKAMTAIGLLRLALDDWRHDRSNAPLAQHLDHRVQDFAKLRMTKE